MQKGMINALKFAAPISKCFRRPCLVELIKSMPKLHSQDLIYELMDFDEHS